MCEFGVLASAKHADLHEVNNRIFSKERTLYIVMNLYAENITIFNPSAFVSIVVIVTQFHRYLLVTCERTRHKCDMCNGYREPSVKFF